MGYNTTVIVMNDALHVIEKDPEFGKKLVQAIHGLQYPPKERKYRLDVSAGGHANAATVIETHHADQTVVVAIGGNYGSELGMVWGWSHHSEEDQVRIIKELYEEKVLKPAREKRKKENHGLGS